MDRFCPDCGLALPEKEEGAGCPHCLLRLAMGEEPGDLGATSQPATPPGLRSRFFGDYELLSELARGGMGVIYRARQITLNRTVALKMIHPGQLTSPEAWLRFQTEIAASAHLHHPHIVPLHETGTADGMHFFTMHLLEGGNLASRLAAGRKAPNGEAAATVGCASRASQEAVAQMMIKVARAVHYAHQRGVLHRDLKPSNILLDDKGEPHVADFGLAKNLAQQSAATLTDSILGSPNYMAPEQADARSKNVTVETDVYGLGAVLYEALMHVPPFHARTPVETIRKVLDEEPVPPRKLNPAIDADLETICLKCLQKNPSARYRSAEELAADLERWMQRLPILARPVGPIGTLVRWTRRRPALAALSGLLLLTIIGVAVGASLAAVRIGKAEQAAIQRLRESLLDQARVLRTSQAAGGRTEGRQLLRQAAALGGSAEFRERLRDEALATLGLPQVGFTPVADLKGESSRLVLMDPKMKQLARIADGTNLTIVRLEETTAPRTFGHTAPGGQLEAFSPDGRCVAVRNATGLDFHDVESGRLIFSGATRSRVYCFATHTPLVALEEDDCEISFRELPTGREIRRLQLPTDPAGSRGRGFLALSLSPDGALLACARAVENAIELVDMNTGSVRWRRPQDAATRAMAWYPSRGRLFIAMSDGRYVALRLTDGVSALSFYSAAAGQSLSVHDGTGRLAAACRDRRIRIWDLSSVRLLFETECDGRNLAFDETAARLGTAIRGERVGWLTFEQRSEFKETMVASKTRNIEVCAFSGKGDLIAIGYPSRVALVNSTSHAMCGGINMGEIPVIAMDPRGEFMLTSALGVVLRPLPQAPSEMFTGDEGRLVIPGARWRALAITADGSRVWAANAASNMIYGFSRDFTPEGIPLGPLEFVDAIGVSTDSRWVAGGSSLLQSAKVWDARSGTEALTLHAGRYHRLSFSADGRWFAVHGDVFDLRRVGSWESAPPLPYPADRPTLSSASFSPDGKVLAVVEDQDQIRLFDLAAWKSLGLLRAPFTGSINALAFSPDGTMLAAACAQGRLRTWNLQGIRAEMAALNLDWY